MGIEQKLLQEKIDNNEMIVQCCSFGLYRTTDGKSWVGFRLKEPYKKVSHAYCPEQFENIMYGLKLEKINKNDTKI